jgi:hypothetical protein
MYSNWSDWSSCRSSDCTSIRTRQCLQEPCLDYLVESRSCRGNLCSSKKMMMMMTIHLIFLLSKHLIQFDYNERRRLVTFPTLLNNSIV